MIIFVTDLLNCEDELLRFYRKRKAELQKALDESEYVELPNGKRRRKGPSLPDVPPDPRPFDTRVQEFFDVTDCVLEDEVFVRTKNDMISTMKLFNLTIKFHLMAM